MISFTRWLVIDALTREARLVKRTPYALAPTEYRVKLVFAMPEPLSHDLPAVQLTLPDLPPLSLSSAEASTP